MLRMYRVQPRRAKIGLISGFGAIIVAARLYVFFTDRPGIPGTVAAVAIVAMLIGGAIALYIGFTSLDWNKARSGRGKRRRP